MAFISYLTRIQFGFGTLSCLQAECNLLKIRRPLIVTDLGVRKTGIIDTVCAQLDSRMAVTIFDGTPANPNEAAVRTAVQAYKAEGCDGIIAVGGGSAIDLAKGAAIAATHEGELKNFAVIEGGIDRITAATAPVIAIPTTAGTGSEVGRGALIILDDGRKLGLLSPFLIPRVAICDPQLTMSLPPLLTAATGMDALCHCIETYLASAFNPPADGIALEGLRRGWLHIERATRNPEDREARTNMMSASMQGALAFQKGLGCVHSLSHALGAVDPALHHGTLNAILLPAVIEFNSSDASVVQGQKIERLAQVMGLAKAVEVGPAILAITDRLGLPHQLSSLGVTEVMFQRVINGALADHCHKTNPREASPEDYAYMLAQSL